MPFTLVHPAAVLPLARPPFVASALVFGAVAPDVPYFVSLRWLGGDVNLTLTHQWTSVLWFDPMVALVLFVVFHLVLKRPVAALLPPSAAGRLAPVLGRAPRRDVAWFVWIVISCALGAATHLIWDEVCDAFGWEWSTQLNVASGVVGAMVLMVWAFRWWHSTPVETSAPEAMREPRSRWAVVGALVAVAVAMGAYSVVTTLPGVQDDLRADGRWTRWAVLEHGAREFVIDGAAALAVATLFYAVAWHGRRHLAGRA